MPTDPSLKHITNEQWMMYFQVMQKQDVITLNMMRAIAELVAMISNPDAFKGYKEHMDSLKDTAKTTMTTSQDGLVDVVRSEETGEQISMYEIENIINSINFNEQG